MVKGGLYDGAGSEGQSTYSISPTNYRILDLIEKICNGEYSQNEKVNFGVVDDGIATKIKEETGISVYGFKVAIDAKQLKHIINEYGKNGKSDRSLSNYLDIARMEFVLNNPDSIVESGRTRAYTYMEKGRNKTAKTVLYEKSIGEKSYYVVQAVPNTKSKTLYVVTAFIGKRGYKKKTPNSLM